MRGARQPWPHEVWHPASVAWRADRTTINCSIEFENGRKCEGFCTCNLRFLKAYAAFARRMPLAVQGCTASAWTGVFPRWDFSRCTCGDYS